MKLTVKQLLEATDALRRLGDKSIKVLTPKVFHNVSRSILAITKSGELELYESARQSLIKCASKELPIHTCLKCGLVTNENGYGVPPSDVRQLNIDIEKEQMRETEDLKILTCTVTDEIIENAGISASDLAALDWMFILPEEKE